MKGTFVTARAAGDFVLNALFATIGVAIVETPFWGRPNTGGYREFYLKELALSAGLAFLLGGLIHLRCRIAGARWVWIIGVCTFGWQFATGGNPGVGEDPLAATWAFVSIRFVFYSLGAICGGWLKPLSGGRK